MLRQWDQQRVQLLDPKLAECLPELIGPNDRGQWGGAPRWLLAVTSLSVLPHSCNSHVLACFLHALASQYAVGTLRPEAAEVLGLPTGVIVSPGSGDNACSALVRAPGVRLGWPLRAMCLPPKPRHHVCQPADFVLCPLQGAGAVNEGSWCLSLGTSGENRPWPRAHVMEVLCTEPLTAVPQQGST